jgi:ABC-type nickel/cobalt efflux system permease component RcnA
MASLHDSILTDARAIPVDRATHRQLNADALTALAIGLWGILALSLLAFGVRILLLLTGAVSADSRALGVLSLLPLLALLDAWVWWRKSSSQRPQRQLDASGDATDPARTSA